MRRIRAAFLLLLLGAWAAAALVGGEAWFTICPVSYLVIGVISLMVEERRGLYLRGWGEAVTYLLLWGFVSIAAAAVVRD
jgi:hypothetical protein